MKKSFSKNELEIFQKVLHHYIPDFFTYVDEIKDPRKRKVYSMRYLFASEMLMFASEGKSQRFTEKAFSKGNCLSNISKFIGENVEKTPEADIYTNVFSKIEEEEIKQFQAKINNHMFRNKFFASNKVLNKYNCVLDATTFQKANYEVSGDWLTKTSYGVPMWYLSMLDCKLVANGMAISIANEMINNEDKKIIGETENDVKNKSEEQIKQDCEINASKRLLNKLKKQHPRLQIRIVADSLYPSETLIDLCEQLNYEYIFVLKDKKIPSITNEFLCLISLPDSNRVFEFVNGKYQLTMWENYIDYKDHKVNVIRQITRNANTNKDSVWMWITNKKVTQSNVNKLIACAKSRDYIENQGFKEQKVTSGIDLKHVYSKNIKAINVIYTLIQITHMILQIIEHSDICGKFKNVYGSVKEFEKLLYTHLIANIVNTQQLSIKIQIRFDPSLMIV